MSIRDTRFLVAGLVFIDVLLAPVASREFNQIQSPQAEDTWITEQ